MEKLLHNKWVLYGGVAVAAFVGYKVLFAGGSADAASGSETGNASYPDVTYAATPISGSGSTGSGDIGTSMLEALRDAVKPDSTIELAKITAAEKAAGDKNRVSIYSSLATTLAAQKGLHYIRAIIPGLGQFVVTNVAPKKKPVKK